jgi:DNA repair protein RadC
MLMLQERTQAEATPLQVRETASLALAPTWLLGPEHPIQCLATNSAACNALELLSVLVGAPLAQALWQHYGSLQAIARASALELVRNIRGLGARRAAHLKAACELGQRAQQALPAVWPIINEPVDIFALLAPLLRDKEQEYLYVLFLNTRGRVLTAPKEIYHGCLNGINVRINEIFREAIKLNAAGIVIAHNHPSGDPSPSPEDIRLTHSLRDAGQLLDIEVLDHCIIGRYHCVSLKEMGKL